MSVLIKKQMEQLSNIEPYILGVIIRGAVSSPVTSFLYQPFGVLVTKIDEL